MLISYNWLRELVETPLPPKDLAEKLTLIGLELDGMHEAGDDTIFDIEVTSNRGDCLSHLGVAREISAFSDTDVSLPESLDTVPDDNETDLVTIESPEHCHRFTARVITGVNIGPSPEWLVKRLEAIGERSINNVADITNLVMHEIGQPMHSFDLDKLSGGRIVVRTATEGEKITTLDEFERKLTPEMLAICDAEKPVAVGGVMGGIGSGITEETTNVLLEVAYFDRDSIRKTSRDLNLSTEASYHFERGVNIENLALASNRATHLICELAGGTPGEFVDVYPTKFKNAEISAPNLKSEVHRLSGLDVDETEISRILTRLGIEKLSEGVYRAPAWRHDLGIDEDLVEEVVRIVGYNKIGDSLPSALSAGEYQPSEMRKRRLRSSLADNGFDEALSYSFIDQKHDGEFELVKTLVESPETAELISINDPVIEGSTRMRPTLVPGILDAVRVNFNQQNKNLKLYEIGKAFGPSTTEDNLPTEKELMTIVVTGGELVANRALTSRVMDFFDVKGAVELSARAIGIEPPEFREADVKHLQPGQSAELFLDGKSIGYAGRVNGELSSRYKFKQDVYLAEFDLSLLLGVGAWESEYESLPVYPAISRDVSLIVDRKLSFDAIRSEIANQNEPLCTGIEFVDVFEGKGLSDSERSVTLRLEYRLADRTLVDEEVEAAHSELMKNLAVNLGIKQR